MHAISKWLTALGLLVLTFGPTAQAAQPVLQRGYDAGVSGANLTETTLNTSNVAPSTFGLVFKLPLDDSVLAQPLYVPNVAIPSQGTHNVVYVATMSDTLYAFDADTGAQLWSVNFATSVGATPVPYAKFAFSGNRNIVGNLGILSTPVIDPSTNILYLVACTLEDGGTTMVYRLHAVNITSGTEPYTNVQISNNFVGPTFDAPHQTQRLSLVLSGNQVVFGFGAMEEEGSDIGGYVGWVMAYDKTTLGQSGAFATVKTGTMGGGVWQSGRPPVVDSSGYVCVFVGNGYTRGYDGVNNFSESALKLDPATGLNLLDWFTPDDWAYLDENDLDLSASGPLLIPDTSPSLLAGGGKAGVLYVLKTANLGKESATDSGVAQEETITNEFRGGPVYWQRSSANGGPLLYNWGARDSVKAYAFNGATFATTPSSQGSGTQIWPGGILALSADSDTPGSGVLWATVATSGDAENNPPAPGELHAFDAGNVSQELWNSTMNASRDGFGNFAKFVPPLVANGKVYVATWSNQLAVYGLLSTYTVSPTSLAFGSETTNVASAPMLITVTNTGTVSLPITSITLSAPSPNPFSQTNTCGTSVAVGATCTISAVFKPTSAGPKTATLSVNAGGGAGTQNVALSGTGVVPTYTVSPTSLAFGGQMINVASAPMLITVTNTGTVSLPITSVTLSAPSPNPFSQTNTCGTSVAVGASCTVSVVFNPASAGSANATLSVNAGGKTSTVNLSGNGSFMVVLTASSNSVTVGVPAALTWSSTPGATCTASGGTSGDNWTGQLAASGSQSVSEASSGNYNYALTCIAQGVSATATATVAVTLPTVTLSAAPTSITVGQSVTLTWTSENAVTCVASGGQPGDGWATTRSLNGTATVTPNTAGTITYTITCSSGPESPQSIAQVIATSPPSSAGGGGALDPITLLSLLTMIGLRQRRKFIPSNLVDRS
ncbi:MAG: choice-of-anchor D domain-containing protein [Steroidobacteraceae bacterium]